MARYDDYMTKESLSRFISDFSVGDVVLVPESMSSLSKNVVGTIVSITDSLVIVECQYKRFKMKEAFSFADAKMFTIKNSVKKRVYREGDLNDIIGCFSKK